MTETPTNPVELLNALGHDNPTPEYRTFATGEPTPIEMFGSDHWTTFAYLETRVVDHRGKVNHDQLRCDRSRHPFMFSAGRRRSAFDTGDGGNYPTRLKGGVERADHDDYDCIDDMVAAGLVTITMPRPGRGQLVTGLAELEMSTKATYRLTRRGKAVAAELRAARADGVASRDFTPSPEALAR